jgi:hypothetical protein
MGKLGSGQAADCWFDESLMLSDMELLGYLYERFNAREMEGPLATMYRDVMWANGMEVGTWLDMTAS